MRSSNNLVNCRANQPVWAADNLNNGSKRNSNGGKKKKSYRYSTESHWSTLLGKVWWILIGPVGWLRRFASSAPATTWRRCSLLPRYTAHGVRLFAGVPHTAVLPFYERWANAAHWTKFRTSSPLSLRLALRTCTDQLIQRFVAFESSLSSHSSRPIREQIQTKRSDNWLVSEQFWTIGV